MTSRIVAIGTWLCLAALAGCGGDDTGPMMESDSGMDAGDNNPDGGAGGSGGSGAGGHAGGGSGGSSGGSGGSSGGAGGMGGAGGAGGAGGIGGAGGSSAAQYSVGGDVSGLSGKGLVLKLNDSEELAVSDNGNFEFTLLLAKGDDYSVSVKTQPSDPVQACAVEKGSGKLADVDISNVKISCSTVMRSVGGSVTGLGGGTIKLKNNGGDELTVTQDGDFTFATPLNQGADYAVTVSAAPAGRTCSVANATGKTGTSNVTDVAVDCYAGLILAARGRPGSVELSWNNNGATAYNAYLSTDVACSFDTPDSCAGAAKQQNVTSPYLWMGLEDGKTYYFHVRGTHPNNFETRSGVSGARPNVAEFDSPVHAIALGGDGTVYVGGEFSSIGALTGPLAPLDTTTAKPTRMPNFPIAQGGSVQAVVPDGSGGYFVGGGFSALGDVNINNLAHVLPTGAVDTTWTPDPDDRVTSLALVGSTLYVAGAFTQVGGQPRTGLAAVSAQGAGAASSWNPQLQQPGGSVNAIVANATTVYVAGSFSNVGGADRQSLAALDATTGNATSFDPSPNNGAVQALALTSDTLYVSGYFDTIAGVSRTRLAALDLTGVARDFAATPTSTALATALLVAGDTLYLGGDFTDIDGTARDRLAAVDAVSGALKSWNPSADDTVQALASSGDIIYAAGDFTTIGGAARKYLAAIDKQGALTSWDAKPGAPLTVLAADSNTVYASGGTVTTYGAEARARLASFKQGALTAWGPQVSGGDVLALAVSGSTLYFGGDFDSVGGSTRNGAAAVDTGATATLGSWDAQMNNGAVVQALLASGNRVYAGGTFSAAGGGAHMNIVALAADTGQLASGWGLSGASGGSVDALTTDGTKLYLGGNFDTVYDMTNSLDRTRLAAVDPATGAIDSWAPAANAAVHALVYAGGNVVAGGEFAMVDAVAHAGLVAIDASGTVDDAWNPAVDDAVRALVVSSDVLYVGGDFLAFGAIDRGNLAAIDTANNFNLLPWAPGVSGTRVYALAVDSSGVLVGGDFRGVGGQRCQNFCTTEPN